MRSLCCHATLAVLCIALIAMITVDAEFLAPESFYPLSVPSPAQSTFIAASASDLGLKFAAVHSGLMTAIQWFKPNGAATTLVNRVFRLWKSTPTPTLMYTFSVPVSEESSNAFNIARLPQWQWVTPGDYVVTYSVDNVGPFAYTPTSGPAGPVLGGLRSIVAVSGMSTTSLGTYPDVSVNGNTYYVSPVFTTGQQFDNNHGSTDCPMRFHY